MRPAQGVLSSLLLVFCTVQTFGCAKPFRPQDIPTPVREGSPLGPSYVLVPLPTEDDALLGRIVPQPPAAGRSIEETARANPCLPTLEETRTTPLANTFDDAEELGVDARARAMLGAFGFEGDVSRATHFTYRLETSRRVAKTEGPDYAACCKEKGCGYGYVSALIYGEGEYATGEELSGRAKVGVGVVEGGGGVKLRVLHKRKVRGWLAAVITVTDASKGDPLGPLGAASMGVTEDTIPDTVKQIYERNKVKVEREDDSYVFKDGAGREIKEVEFARDYLAVTGSHDLDALDRRRNPGSFAASGVLTAASLGIFAYGITHLSRPCTQSDVGFGGELDCYDSQFVGSGTSTQIVDVPKPGATTTNGTGIAMAIGGAFGTIGFGTWFLVAAFRRDGSTTSHLLSERDAIIYADQHNRALLRNAAKRLAQPGRTSTIEVTPVFSTSGVGLMGRF
jgi:hypothetical protein